jgi:hypothetical protein
MSDLSGAGALPCKRACLPTQFGCQLAGMAIPTEIGLGTSLAFQAGMNNHLRVTNGAGPVADNVERATLLALGTFAGTHHAWITCGAVGTFDIVVARDGKWMFACSVMGSVEQMRDDIRTHAQNALEGRPLAMPTIRRRPYEMAR